MKEILDKLKLDKYKHLVIGTVITFLLLSSVGLTYGWFIAMSEGEGNQISIKSKELKLIYTDPLVVDASSIEPGWTLTKTFTVENTTDEVKYYKIMWNDLVNTFVTDYLTIEMSSTNGGASVTKSPIAKSSTASDIELIDAVMIEGNTTQTYTVTFEYEYTEADQTADMGKEFSGSIELYLLDSNVGDFNIIAYTCNTCSKSLNQFPSKESGYVGNVVTCTNGATAVWNNAEWDIDFTNIESETKCTVDFKEGDFLYKKILSDNPNVSIRSSFDTAFTTSNNGNTIYSASGQDNKTTYYFAGSVTNNYVYFGGLYWRIVRINEDNSIRLIYAGVSAEDTAGFSNTSQQFNSSSKNSEYIGYKYTIGEQHGLGTDSLLKTELDSWYSTNLNSSSTVDASGNKYDKYVSRTAIYCNDRGVGTGTWVSTGTAFNYAAHTRLLTNKAPTYVCSETNDRFTTSTKTGNGELYNSSNVESPVALITADEVSYAGGVFGISNTSYYMYQNASSGADYWWTMSPYYWSSSANLWCVGGTTDNGRLRANTTAAGTRAVRPVISLKACVEWEEGNGTTTSPYKVKINSSCVSTEN